MNSYFRDFHVVFSEENNNLLKLLLLDICYYVNGVCVAKSFPYQLVLCSGAFKSTAMHLLHCYNSNNSSSSEDECLTKREFRSVYLVTYSQADVAKFHTREVFARTSSPFRLARQKSFSECAVGKSIEKAESIIIWQSNWTETSNE